MQPFTKHTGIAVPLLKDDINTDQVAPVQAMRALKPDYKALLFMRARQRDDGSEDPDFVLNKPQFRNPGILVTGHNFGAGSSREAAVWGMLANNIRVIVARSFADIYRENCLQNGLLPVVLAPSDADAFEQRVIAAMARRRSPSISRPRPSAARAAPMSHSISRPRTARVSWKGSMTSGSRSSTPTRSRRSSKAWRHRSPGCRPRPTAAYKA
ncbi:MAG: hypothetical protein GEU95_12530 [Rhizobiales bacterium]|nr:hypothetical protein [Hyphomicrobiales bacterium]